MIHIYRHFKQMNNNTHNEYTPLKHTIRKSNRHKEATNRGE